MGKATPLTIKSKAGATFKCLLNPTNIQYHATIRFHEDETIGVESPEVKFFKKEPEKVTITLLLDGTGALGTFESATSQFDSLKKAVLTYQGAKHEIAPVTLNWGSILKSFVCRLEEMKVDYKLFTASGAPLRIEVILNFVEDTPAKVDVSQRNANSPDLSHLITVKEGDTLPDMCEKVYGNANMYLEVARINRLTNFRSLKAGTELLFPPIEKV